MLTGSALCALGACTTAPSERADAREHTDRAPAPVEISRTPSTDTRDAGPNRKRGLFATTALEQATLQLLNGGQTPTQRKTQLTNSLSTSTAKFSALNAAPANDAGWPYQLAAATPQAAAPTVGGGLDQVANPGAPLWLVRYSCCNSLPLFIDPALPFLANGSVSQGELLRVHDVIPGAGIQSKLAPASANTILPDLLNPADGLYWARVEAPSKGIQGWVPLYSLLMSAPESRADHVQVDFSYGKLAREVNSVWTERFSPPGCEEANVKNEVATKPGDCFLVDEEWGWEQKEYETTCDEVSGLYQGMKAKADAGDQDCTSVFIGEGSEDVNDPAAWTTSCATVFDLMFVEYPEKLLVPNTNDHQCGEYRFGKTHWDGYPHLDDKKLEGFELWNRHVSLKAKRLSGQRAADFDVKSLTHHGQVISVEGDKKITSEKLWFGFSPHGPDAAHPAGYTELKVCAFMPGNHFWSPEVLFDPKDTPGNAVESIQFGSLTVGQLQGCLYGELYLAAGWQPQIVWTDLDDWWIDHFDADDLNITFDEWVYGTAVAGTVVLPALLGATGTLVSQIVNKALATSVILPAVINTLDETWLAQGMVIALSETFLSSYTLKWMQDATDDSVNASIPRFQPMAQAVCGSVCPPGTPPAGHPLQPFCTRCNDFANSDAPFEFVRDPGAEAKGCYDVDALFTPEGKTAPSASPWWHDYAGHGWADGSHASDKGCKLGFQVSGSLEKRSWEFAKCAMWRANMLVNQDLPLSAASLQNQIGSYCNDVGREMLRLYFGSGQDLKAMLAAKHPPIQSTVVQVPLPPPPAEFPITGSVHVIVEPPPAPGLKALP